MTITNFIKGTELQGSIIENNSKCFIAVTTTTSKTYKTFKGALKFMTEKGYREVKDVITDTIGNVTEVVENTKTIEEFTTEVKQFIIDRTNARIENDLPIFKDKTIENTMYYIESLNSKYNTNHSIDIESLVNEIINNLRGGNMTINVNELKLKIGQKYTVLKPNNLLPECLQFTLINYFISDYAQHKNQLFLIVRYKGHRSNSRLIIANETAFLFNGWNFSKSWNKETVSNTMSRLHRITLNDVKNHKDFIYNIPMFSSFTTNNDIFSFSDYTTDYIIDNGVRGAEQLKHEGYYSYIKQLIREKSYNLNELLRQCKAWDYIYLVTLLDKIQKDWN